jgi:hypothetical protein
MSEGLEKMVVHRQYAGYSEVFKKFGAQDEVPDADDEIPEPVGQAFAAAPVRVALAKSDTPMSISRDWLDVPADDVDDGCFELQKSPMVVKDEGPRTLAKKLRVVKTTTEADENGTQWVRGYDASGVLVDTRVLLPDRG